MSTIMPPQLINPLFGNICENAKIYIGKVGTDGMVPDNRQDVYLVRLTDESTLEKVPLPQPLLTNSAGVICYEGLPVTPWVDSAYSITIEGYDGAIIYSAFYVDDPTYWLRLDLATEPKKIQDGLYYDPEDKPGVNLVAGAAPILSPDFKGEPRAITPPATDSSTRLATTEFVRTAVSAALSVGIVGACQWWTGNSPPDGAVVLDGSSLLKEDYEEAYNVIGDAYAIANDIVPDSAYFIIPDCRSRYIRGYNYGASLSSYADFMKKYEDMFESHNHGLKTWSGADASEGGGNNYMLQDIQDFGDENLIESVGGSETMPKTLVMLPIMWVTPPEKALPSGWHPSAERPAIHHYHPETGELLTSSLAQPSPLSRGHWLTPANATQQAPVASKPGHVVVFRNGNWGHDAELFRLRQEQRELERETREKHNQELMAKAQRRAEFNDWLKQNVAPFTLDDLG
ncbi:phage tailspike protein [Enterobacter mori]|uniref:phage tailspike protein n=1 Tax=Enterobacter mori TaxID=539813 RepID=UPI003B83A971